MAAKSNSGQKRHDALRVGAQTFIKSQKAKAKAMRSENDEGLLSTDGEENNNKYIEKVKGELWEKYSYKVLLHQFTRALFVCLLHLSCTVEKKWRKRHRKTLAV